MLIAKGIILVYTLLFLSQQAQSQTADEIVKKHIEAIGGYEKIKGIKTMIFEGTFKLPNKERTFKSYIIHDSAVRSENTDIGITGYGIITKNEGWEYIPASSKSSVKKKSKQEVKDAQSTLDVHGPLVDYIEKGNKITYLGKETVKEKECFKLRLIKSNKKAFIFYFDSTYLISRVIYLRHDWVPEFTLDYSYKRLDEGISFVIKSIRLEDGMETTYNYYLINPEIDRSLFTPDKL